MPFAQYSEFLAIAYIAFIDVPAILIKRDAIYKVDFLAFLAILQSTLAI